MSKGVKGHRRAGRGAGTVGFGRRRRAIPSTSRADPMAARHCSGPCSKANIPEAERLVKAGADVSATNNYGINPMLLAADIANTDLIRLAAEGRRQTPSRPIRTARPPCTWWRAPATSKPRRCC